MPRTRRQPNFVAFISTGVIVGFVVGSFVGSRGPVITEYGHSYTSGSAVMFVGVLGACVFGLLAAVVAVLLDRRE